MPSMEIGNLRWRLLTHKRGLHVRTPRWALAIFRSMKDDRWRLDLRRRPTHYSRREMLRLRRQP